MKWIVWFVPKTERVTAKGVDGDGKPFIDYPDESQYTLCEAQSQFIDRGGVLNFLVFEEKVADPETGKKARGKPKSRSIHTFANGVWKEIEELSPETT